MPLEQEQLEAIDRIKESAEDTFDKNALYISAGTLGLSMTFIEKIVNVNTSTNKVFLIISWSLLALSILINLISHQLTAHYTSKCRDFWANCPDVDMHIGNSMADKYNNRIKGCNWATSFLIALGIIFLVIFSSLNITNKPMIGEQAQIKKYIVIKENQIVNNKLRKMNDTKIEVKIDTTFQSGGGTKGATISKPVKTTGGKK